MPHCDLSRDLSSHERQVSGIVRLRHVLGGRDAEVDGVALLTYATARIPDDSLAAPLRAAGVDVHVIGDCFAPRSLLVASGEGYAAGMRL